MKKECKDQPVSLDTFGTLNASGTAEIEVQPDEALVDLTIITEGKTAAQAVAANATRAQAVIDAVSAEPTLEVTTSGLTVMPRYQWNEKTGMSTLIGYRATNTVKVRTKIENAGRIFDVGIQAGANESSGISFQLSDETKYRLQALEGAVEKAMIEARVVARTAGVIISGIDSINITSGERPWRYLFDADTLAMAKAAAPPTPVLAEKAKVEATVHITFRTRS